MNVNVNAIVDFLNDGGALYRDERHPLYLEPKRYIGTVNKDGQASDIELDGTTYVLASPDEKARWDRFVSKMSGEADYRLAVTHPFLPKPVAFLIFDRAEQDIPAALAAIQNDDRSVKIVEWDHVLSDFSDKQETYTCHEDIRRRMFRLFEIWRAIMWARRAQLHEVPFNAPIETGLLSLLNGFSEAAEMLKIDLRKVEIRHGDCVARWREEYAGDRTYLFTVHYGDKPIKNVHRVIQVTRCLEYKPI